MSPTVEIVKGMPMVRLPAESGRLAEKPMMQWVNEDYCFCRYAQWLAWVKPGLYWDGTQLVPLNPKHSKSAGD